MLGIPSLSRSVFLVRQALRQSSEPVHSERSRRDMPNFMLPTVPFRLQCRQNGIGLHMKSSMLLKLSTLCMSM